MTKMHLTILSSALLLLGCSTFLSIDEQSPSEKCPGGVVVNQPAAYQVTLSQADPPVFKVKESDPREPLVGVSEDRVIAINIRRMPFASGTLTLKLQPDQTLKEIGVTSQTGAARAATAAMTSVDTYQTIDALDEAETKQSTPPAE